jgi:hypothetical protein
MPSTVEMKNSCASCCSYPARFAACRHQLIATHINKQHPGQMYSRTHKNRKLFDIKFPSHKKTPNLVHHFKPWKHIKRSGKIKEYGF